MDIQSNFIESIDDFKISFGGKNTIDAGLFTKTINNTIELVKSCANAINPNCFLRLEIKANKEGSFETIIDAVVKHTPDLFSALPVAGSIIQDVLNCFIIKQHLKGNKPKRIEKNNEEMAILNQNNEILKTSIKVGDVYFKNNKIDNLIVNIGESLVNSDRESFSIEAKQGKVVIDKEDYTNIATPIIDEHNVVVRTEKHKPVEINLLLKKPDLLGRSQWEFVYNKTISAKIEDQDFLEKVHKGKIKKLYAGVKIPCLLQIEYDVDEYYNSVINGDRYTILKITGDIIEPEPDTEKNLSLF